ncbi:hypothetical protein Godav_021378 [Gossypium davidsonii]|uniref:Helicase C-terminal domain-containing protein n=1 Tax=Gossypium davidsonii TaxID=34287 RepID=A0A7J8R6B0_GOSDV|nr:hypothetical protein [Gossypium davidsonii]
MLPRHINIILLSATVPNTIEFADWIGRTKQKKIRVTGTTKRPVPLEHCLFYSGELYKICEGETFIPPGLKAAKDAYKKKNSSATSGGTGSYSGSSTVQDGARGQKREPFNRGKQNKHSGPQNFGNYTGTGWGNQSNGGGQNSWGSRRTTWLMLIDKLSKKSLLPAVIFGFSKNQCDKSADSISGTDLTSSSEKSEIRLFCDKAFSRLKGSDRNLPQVVRVQSLLCRGIGVHHAGLLPIVKEVVEMLFCRGVIKVKAFKCCTGLMQCKIYILLLGFQNDAAFCVCRKLFWSLSWFDVLFSTETFAMGVNAPARTVVFDTLRKFDGKEFRPVLPGEYTQMAGRAGRRGLDKIGTVIVMCRDEIPGERDLEHVEDMLKRSFAEFHSQKKLPEQQQLLLRKLAQPKKTIECIKGEPAIEEYYEMRAEAEAHSEQISKAVMQTSVAQKFLTPGRVVVVKSQSAQDHLLGVVLKSSSANNKQYIVLLLKPDVPSMTQSPSDRSNLQDKKGADFDQGYVLPPKSKRGLEEDYRISAGPRKGSGIINITLPHHGAAAGVTFEVREAENTEFLCICNSKIKLDLPGLLEFVSNAAFSHTVQQLLKLKSNGNKYPPALDPKDLKLKDMDLVTAYDKWTHLLQKMSQNKCHECIKLEEHIKLAKEIKKYKEEVNALQFELSNEALLQMPEFQGRIDILKEIGYIDEDLVVQIKGRVACEMNSGEELICTECLFENQLDDLEPEEAVALMSAFVFQQKNTSEPSLTSKLSQAKQRLSSSPFSLYACEVLHEVYFAEIILVNILIAILMLYDTAIRLGDLQAEFKLQITPEEYAQENLKFGLVEVVYEWAKGTPFADICELTDVPEGLIVRTIVRLDETCREFKTAAAIMGNSSLYKKMESASNAIKRDIVFAASLYITGV